MKFSHVIDGGRHGRFSVMFAEKPPASIRQMMRANGFRWNPREGFWYRRSIHGAADFLWQLDRRLHPDRPDGTCWQCKSRPGFFRPRGAACPVLCAECSGIPDPQPLQPDRPPAEASGPDPVDLAHEDACARACGL